MHMWTAIKSLWPGRSAGALPTELVILCRIVQTICWYSGENKLNAGGYGACANAMDILAARNMIENVTGIGRGIRADWAREDWQASHGVLSANLDQEVIEAILLMAKQFLLPCKTDTFEFDIGEYDNNRAMWLECMLFLEKIGVAELDPPCTEGMTVGTREWAIRMGKIGPDIRTHQVVRGRIIDRSYLDRT